MSEMATGSQLIRRKLSQNVVFSKGLANAVIKWCNMGRSSLKAQGLGHIATHQNGTIFSLQMLSSKHFSRYKSCSWSANIAVKPRKGALLSPWYTWMTHTHL